MHHAFVIEAEREAGTRTALERVERELGLRGRNNPDIVALTFGLFSVEEARKVAEIAAATPVSGEKKAIIVAASRVYHEAQNALLKLFEEPPQGVYLFFVLPSLGGLLPTLRSRVQVLPSLSAQKLGKQEDVPEAARQFIAATREKRSAVAKKLASGKNEEERRVHRDEALALVNGIEAAVCEKQWRSDRGLTALLEEIQEFRMCLALRSAPTRMILEHLAIVVPADLL